MSIPFKGVVKIDIKDSTPDWAPYRQPMVPEGAPSVLYVIRDDVGFSALEPFGGTIETPNGMPAEGTLSLYIDDEKVGEGKIKTQPAKFSLAGEGLNVGMDRGEPVTSDHPGDSPWAFVGGTIQKVVVDVAGDPGSTSRKTSRRRSPATDKPCGRQRGSLSAARPKPDMEIDHD